MSVRPKRRAADGDPEDGAIEVKGKAIGQIRRWRKDPVAFVREIFGAEPDAWQHDALEAVARDPKVAMSACKGPGKSCLLAWVIWWFLYVHEDAQVMAVSITSDNLKDNLWKELAVWRMKSNLLQDVFELTAERITHKERPRVWWCSARSFPKQADETQQTNTLAGFHGTNILVVLDELGDYPAGVLPAAEAIFANKVNAKLVVAGNPTRVNGPLHSIVTKDASRWAIIFITGDPDDPKRSPRIDIDWARAEIKKNGRDNPWVMVNILGKFPPAASNQLIAVNLVIDALARDVPLLAYRSDARVWGLDPARFGDDEIVLAKRQGVVAFRMQTWRNLNGTQLGDAVGRELLEAEAKGELPDAVFVDVGGNGSSAFDRLHVLGWEDLVIGIDFGSKAEESSRYANKRTEMWWLMMEWLRDRPACLPTDNVLQEELAAPTFDFRIVQKQTVFILEPKEQMKKRGVPSPNRADALALTFAAPVVPNSREARRLANARQERSKTSYDPLAHVDHERQARATTAYNPLGRAP